MSDLDFMEDAPVTGDNDLKQLSNLVKVLSEKRREVSLLEDQLKQLKGEERKLSEEEIPEFMQTKGLSALTTEDGFKVSIKEDLKAYLPKDPIKRSTALRWIVGNGGESIIKDKVEIEEPEQLLETFLKENGIPYKHLRDVHNRTLVAYMKGLLGISKGSLQTVEISEIPVELGAYMYKKTTIK